MNMVIFSQIGQDIKKLVCAKHSMQPSVNAGRNKIEISCCCSTFQSVINIELDYHIGKLITKSSCLNGLPLIRCAISKRHY